MSFKGFFLHLSMRQIVVVIIGIVFLGSGVSSALGETQPESDNNRNISIAATNSFQLSKKEQQWLSEHPKIQIGTMDAWPPMDYVDSGGMPRGIGSQYIKALNRRLGNIIEIVPAPWADIYNKVKEHKLDALMGITPRPDREQYFHFTKPYVTVPHAIFARKNSPALNKLADLDGKKVGVERGFFIVKLLHENYPGVAVNEYSSTSDALDALAKGEVDAYIGNRAVATYIIENEFISNIQQYGKINETSSINAIGIRKDWPILRDILQRALDDINRDEHREILANWVDADKKHTPVINLSRSEKNWIKTHPVVRVAFDGNYPPYSYRNEQGKLVGIAVDYAQELANRVGITIDIYPEGKWAKLYQAAQQHEVDVIATLVKRKEREEWFEFTRPYLSLAQYLITRKEDIKGIAHVNQLDGKTVALIKDYSMTDVILEENSNIQPYYVKNLTDALEAVSSGKADVAIGAIGMANHIISRSGLSNLGFALLYSKGQSEQRFGVRNDWPELASILDKGLQSLTDKEVIQIFGRWTRPQVIMAEAELFNTALKLTGREREWLAKHPVIRTASDPNWAPIEFIDENGNLQGISADYIKRLEKILDIRFERVKNQTWIEMIENFKKGEIDLFTSINQTPARDEYFNFTRSYTHFPVAIFSGPEAPYIIDMKELTAKKVGVVKGYVTQELMETNYPDINLVTVSDPVAALELLSAGKIDAYVGNILVTSYYIGKLGYTHLKVVGKTPFQYEQSMGVRKDWPLFVSILNKALNTISETDKNAIYNQWIGVHYEHQFDYVLLWKILFAVLIIFVIFSSWNRKLSVLNKQLVAARNREISAREIVEQANDQLKTVDQLKSMFIASMSHELRTPLNSIIGFSGLLLQGVSGELNEKQHDNIQRINRAGNHLLSLISDIIDISKIEAGRVDVFPETFSLKEVVDDAVESIKPLADAKAMQLEVRADSWPEITSDRMRILQCLLNYLSNAVKYSEQGKIILSVVVKEKRLKISVTDMGIGIAEEDLTRLFDAFERMSSRMSVKAGGTGLGLYLTKKIVEEILRGEVSVESKINVGSTFRLEIPLNAFDTQTS